MDYQKGKEIQLKRQELESRAGFVYRIINKFYAPYFSTNLRRTVTVLAMGLSYEFGYFIAPFAEKALEIAALAKSVPAISSAALSSVAGESNIQTINAGLQSAGPSPVPVLINKLFPISLQEIASEGFHVPAMLTTKAIKTALANYEYYDYAVSCLDKGLMHGVLNDGADELLLNEAENAAVQYQDWRTAELAAVAKGDIESAYGYASKLARGPIMPKTYDQYVNEILSELELSVDQSNLGNLFDLE